MCTENTYLIESENRDVFSLDLVPRTTFINSNEIKELMLRLKDDTELFNFFIDNNTLKNSSSDAKYFLSFVQNSKIIPKYTHTVCDKPLYTFFHRLSQNADSMFSSCLKRNIEDVCVKAENIGIIAIESYLSEVYYHGKFLEIIGSPETMDKIPLTHVQNPIICFYKLSDSFYELWIKKEKEGLLLEIWLYHILKDHFANDPNFKIYHSVNVMREGERATNIEELLEEGQTGNSFSVTEIDVLVTYRSKPWCIIECKNKKSNMKEVVHLKGLMDLLHINRGILFTRDFISTVGNPEVFKNVFVESNVMRNPSSVEHVISLIEDSLL